MAVNNSPVRGEIKNREQASQIRDFSGLQYGKITPTDIDAFMEYKDKCYVIIEAKYKEKEMDFGQKLALERLCDDLRKIKPTILILASHEHDTNEDIDFAKCKTKKIFYYGTWRVPKEETSVKRTVDAFLKKHG